MNEYIDSFLDTEATKESVIQAGTAIFQHSYHGPYTTLGEIRFNMFSRKAAAGVIRGCHCTTFTPWLSADSGLDPSTEHVSESQ